MNKSDFNGSYIVKKKILHLARGPSLANITEKNLLEFTLILFWGTDSGLVEILNLYRKWKNEETNSTVLISIRERTMFYKMKNFCVFGFLKISTSVNEKKCKQKFTINIIFLLVSCQSHSSNHILGQKMIKIYAPCVLRGNLSTKIIPASLLSW